MQVILVQINCANIPDSFIYFMILLIHVVTQERLYIRAANIIRKRLATSCVMHHGSIAASIHCRARLSRSFVHLLLLITVRHDIAKVRLLSATRYTLNLIFESLDES